MICQTCGLFMEVTAKSPAAHYRQCYWCFYGPLATEPRPRGDTWRPRMEVREMPKAITERCFRCHHPAAALLDYPVGNVLRPICADCWEELTGGAPVAPPRNPNQVTFA